MPRTQAATYKELKAIDKKEHTITISRVPHLHQRTAALTPLWKIDLWSNFSPYVD